MTVKPLPSRAKIGPFKEQAKDLLKKFKSAGASIVGRVRRYHPGLRGRPNTNDRNGLTDAEILSSKLTSADAQEIIAHEHQFESWPLFVKHLEALNRKG